MKILVPIITALTALIFYSSLIFSDSYTDPMVIPKRFYLFVIVSILILLISIYQFLKTHWKSKNLSVNICLADMFIVLFLAYVIVRGITTTFFSIRNIELALFIAFIVLYFFGKYYIAINRDETRKHSNNHIIFSYLLVTLVLIQGILGLLQYAGLIKTFDPNFRLMGSFNNPGPYAIFLGCLLPYIIGQFVIQPINKWIKYVSIIATLIVTIAIILSGSRTAWIATSLGVLFLLSKQFFLIEKINKIFRSKLSKIAAISFVIIILTISGIYLFNFKKGSAIGRTFIWGRSVEMIVDKPIFGFGNFMFQPTYNDYKASWFSSSGSDNIYMDHSGNVSYAFNDYLQITVEYGIFGLLIFIGIIVSTFFIRKEKNSKPEADISTLIIKSCLLVIYISAMFSYPLQKVTTASIFFLFTGFLAGKQKNTVFQWILSKRMVKSISAICLIASVCFLSYFNRQFRSYREWNTAYHLMKKGNYGAALSRYENVYPELENDKYFLYNYASELSTIGRFQQSILIFEKVKHLLNDYDVYIFLGNSYEGAEQIAKAIASFEKASLLIPYKFYPRYRLIPLYYATGERMKAINLANELLSTKEKIPSDSIDQIKADIRSFLNSINVED